MRLGRSCWAGATRLHQRLVAQNPADFVQGLRRNVWGRQKGDADVIRRRQLVVGDVFLLGERRKHPFDGRHHLLAQDLLSWVNENYGKLVADVPGEDLDAELLRVLVAPTTTYSLSEPKKFLNVAITLGMVAVGVGSIRSKSM